MHKEVPTRQTPSWLEQELESALSPVVAPESLRECVESQLKVRGSSSWRGWPVAAGVMLAVLAGGLWYSQLRRIGYEGAAIAASPPTSEHACFHCHVQPQSRPLSLRLN